MSLNLSNGSVDGIGDVVAKHYDNLPERGREQRSESRIYHMRNFNNWIKSSLINEYMDKLKSVSSDTGKPKLKVLDIGKTQNAKHFFYRCGMHYYFLKVSKCLEL